MLLLNIRKPYIGSPMAPLYLTLKVKTKGNQNLEKLYLVKEPSEALGNY